MIGYNCKYVPVELLAGFDKDCALINSTADSFDYSKSRLHTNLCSYAKAMLEEIHENKYDEIILMNCCDSARRVNDALQNEDIKFSFCFDLPSCNDFCAAEKLKDDLIDFIEKYTHYCGAAFDISRFLAAFKKPEAAPKNKYVALLGARSNEILKRAMSEAFEGEVVDLTCAENRNTASFDVDDGEPLDSVMRKYAKSLLGQIPCMRMQNVKERQALIESTKCAGVVYHTVQFCDYYNYEYSEIKKLPIPVIKVETDFTNQSYGQLLTRLEGFGEAIEKTVKAKKGAKKSVAGKYFAGVDSGSTSTELIIIDENKNIIKQVMVKTGANACAAADNALKKAEIAMDDIAHVVATGYGRKNIAFADDNVTEITCHAKGAKHLFNDTDVIIDIGGQDSKVITLDKNGNITNFAMNDKCAAGTGRFLENMAKALELDMESMAQTGIKYKNDLTISSVCTVFAESEVVSLIAQNHNLADIVHAVNKSVAAKARTLAGGAENGEYIVMTGGVANNNGVVTELEKQMKSDIHIPKSPEFCGALGAALIAVESQK